MEQYDCIVVGAGVIGLAIARRLAMNGLQTLILEKNHRFGEETSSRNSEVIHAGLYYPNDSLKARLCVRGRQLLYQYCDQRASPYKRCGTLVVASASDRLRGLEDIAQNAAGNGVHDLRLLDAAEVRSMEPGLRCSMALLSPSTGIIDSHSLMLSLLADAEAASAMLVCRCDVTRIVPTSGGLDVFTNGASGPAVRTSWLINAAGLHAATLAARVEGFPESHIPEIRYAKGNYFSLLVRAPFSRLVYPMPQEGGLGVHMTLDLCGRARFGPDVEWVDNIDYKVDPARAGLFCEQIARYWPAVTTNLLSPDYSGIRPKALGPGGLSGDFMIEGPSSHGVAGIVNLFGIESPGLTACLAMGDHVAEMVSVGENRPGSQAVTTGSPSPLDGEA